MIFIAGIGKLPRCHLNGALLSKSLDYLDCVVAFTIKSHILDAYKFLASNYCDGDKVYLIGFSRGAFTARALAAMIEKVGLITKGNENLLDLAYQCYIAWEYNGDSGIDLITEFKRTFTKGQISIHFMGLWDSVNSVGLINDKLFPYTSELSNVHHIRHAVSIDERRGRYKQCLFESYTYNPLFFIFEDPYAKVGDDCIGNTRRNKKNINIRGRDDDIFCEGNNDSTVEQNIHPTFYDVQEKWFVGDHCDLGGGWYENPQYNKNGLTNLSFNWMVANAYECGVKFNTEEFKKLIENNNPEKDILYCKHDTLSLKIINRCVNPCLKFLRLPLIPRKKQNVCDENSIIASLFWWIAEIIPLGNKIENAEGKWENNYYPNLGRPRKIPKDAQLHWSVYAKLQADKEYNPSNIPTPIDDIRKSNNFGIKDEFVNVEL